FFTSPFGNSSIASATRSPFAMPWDLDYNAHCRADASRSARTTRIPERRKSMSFHYVKQARLAAAAALGFGLVVSAAAQEVGGAATTTSMPMSKNLIPVTQAMLDGAAKD